MTGGVSKQTGRDRMDAEAKAAVRGGEQQVEVGGGLVVTDFDAGPLLADAVAAGLGCPDPRSATAAGRPGAR